MPIRDVLGKTLQLDRRNYEIVGVAAPRFTWYNADVYLPLKLTQDPAIVFLINLRLRPGVTHATANAALQPLLDEFARNMPKHFPEHFRVQVEGLNEWVVRRMGGTLYLLFGAVGLLLAIGCGNVSILLLARGTARQHELAVRTAVGARRRRIVRQLLTESLLLASIGAVLGVLTSYGMLAGMKTLLPWYIFAPEVVIRINLPVLFFSIGLALITGRPVWIMACAAALACHIRPDDAVERTPSRGKRARAQDAQHADRRTDCADAPALGGSGIGYGGLYADGPRATGVRSPECDVGGNPAARKLVHDMGRTGDLFRAVASEGGGDARRNHDGDFKQRYPAAKRIEFCAL